MSLLAEFGGNTNSVIPAKAGIQLARERDVKRLINYVR